MLNCQKILIALLFQALLGVSPPVYGFFYDHRMTSIPSKLLEPYKQRHHLSDAFETIFKRGLEAYSNMDFKRSEQAYNTLLLINSRDLIALDRLGQVYVKQGKFDLAASALLQCLRIDPTYFPAHDLLARLYLYKKDYKKAIKHAKFLIEGGHAYMETYLTLINALFSMGQFDNVMAISKIARNSGATHPQFEFFPAMIYLMENDIEEFVKRQVQFERDFANHPDLKLYTYLFAAFRNDKTSMKRIDRDIRKQEFIHPVYPYTFLTLALEEIAAIKDLKHVWDLAVRMADRAIGAAPTFLLPYRVGMDILKRQRDFKSILPLTKKGLENFPDYVAFYEFQGEAAFFLEQDKLALESLKTALKIRNNNANYLAYTGILMLKDNQYDPQDAISLLDLATNLDRNNPFAQTGFGLYYYNVGEFQRATIPLKQAISQNVKFPMPYELMVRIERQSENLLSAYQIALKARNVVPDPSIYRHVTELAYLRKEFRNCVKLGQEAARAFPGDKFFPFYMAKSLRDLKDYAKALTVLEKVGVKPENPVEYNLLYLNLLMDWKLLDEARNKVEGLLKAPQPDPAYMRFLGEYHYVQKDFKKSLDIYTNLIRTTGSRVYLVDTGWMNYLLNEKDKGIQELIVGTKQGTRENQALAHYRLGLIYSTKKKTQLESSQNYSKGYELAPRLPLAIRDHKIFNEVTKNKWQKTIEKNQKLYLQ